MQKYIWMSVIFLLLNVSCASIKKPGQQKSFIILNTKDTIYGDYISGTKRFSNLGWVVVRNGKGENRKEKKYMYDEIYQIHYYDRKNRKNVQEIVEENPNYKDTHVEMDIIINQGKVRLYLNDPGFRPDYPFVVSEFYHGYANKHFQRKRLLVHLNKCEAFQTKFTQKEQRKKKNLEKMIRFYNENCD